MQHILVVDDHPLICKGFASMLASSVADVQVSAVSTLAQARAALDGVPAVDWLFLDVQLPEDPQRSLLEFVLTSHWASRTILMSAQVDSGLLRRSLGSGVRGFFPKSADMETILQAFDTVRRGEVFLPPSLAAQLRQDARGAVQARDLSPRILEVQERMLRGASNKAIARDLKLSEYTVKEYASIVIAYHGVGSRLELILKLQPPR